MQENYNSNLTGQLSETLSQKTKTKQKQIKTKYLLLEQEEVEE
jgi:hypothetical protein